MVVNSQSAFLSASSTPLSGRRLYLGPWVNPYIIYNQSEYFPVSIFCLLPSTGDFVDLFCGLSVRVASHPTLLISNMTFVISGSEWKTCTWTLPFWVSPVWLLAMQPLPTVHYDIAYRTIDPTSWNWAVCCQAEHSFSHSLWHVVFLY